MPGTLTGADHAALVSQLELSSDIAGVISFVARQRSPESSLIFNRVRPSMPYVQYETNRYMGFTVLRF